MTTNLVKETAQHISNTLGALEIANHDQILSHDSVSSPTLDIRATSRPRRLQRLHRSSNQSRHDRKRDNNKDHDDDPGFERFGCDVSVSDGRCSDEDKVERVPDGVGCLCRRCEHGLAVEKCCHSVVEDCNKVRHQSNQLCLDRVERLVYNELKSVQTSVICNRFREQRLRIASLPLSFTRNSNVDTNTQGSLQSRDDTPASEEIRDVEVLSIG